MSITKEFDTIAAISTPLGEGAIGIVRLSGSQAVAIAKSVFKGKDLETVPSHTINYGHIIENDEIIYEVMVSVMRAPKPLPVKMWWKSIPTVVSLSPMKFSNCSCGQGLEWLSLVNLPSGPFSMVVWI